MAAVDLLPQTFHRQTLVRARRISEAYVAGMKMPRCDKWKKHRRSSSQSSVHPIPSLMSPAQKQERRLKTRSFDCTRSLSVDSALASLGFEANTRYDIVSDDEEKFDNSYNTTQVSIEVASTSSNPEEEEEQDLFEELPISPDIERLLMSKFREMDEVKEEFNCVMQPHQEVPTQGFAGEEPVSSRRHRKHRRCQSILFRSVESENLEQEMASDLASTFSDFDFDKQQDDSDMIFRRAVVNMISRTRSSRRGSDDDSCVSRSPSPLPTIHEA